MSTDLENNMKTNLSHAMLEMLEKVMLALGWFIIVNMLCSCRLVVCQMSSVAQLQAVA